MSFILSNSYPKSIFRYSKMTQNERFDNQTVLEICEADKKDLQAEVKHLKLSIKSKNQEIGVLRSKLRSSETQMTELQNFLMSRVSALTAKLTHASTTEPQPTLNNDDISSSVHLDDQDANQEPPPVLTSLPTSSTQPHRIQFQRKLSLQLLSTSTSYLLLLSASGSVF